MEDDEFFDLITTDEVSSMLRLSPSAVTDRRRSGDLPYIQMGRRVFFRKSAIVDYLNRCSIGAAYDNTGEQE